MSKQFFWNTWPTHYKRIFQACLALLVAAIAFYLVGYFWSSRLVIQWETISQITTVPLLLDPWVFASVTWESTVDQYLISQIFEGSDLAISFWPAAILLTVIGASLVLALSLAVELPRFWFLVSQVVFIFTMVGFKLEQLLLFNRTDKAALILVFLLYLPTSYYFHAVKKDISLYKRLLTYGVLTLVFAIVVHQYSGVSHPFLYLIDYGIPIPLALTVIFIFFTAHEIIYGFLYLITRSNTQDSSNSFIHFLALSLIYLSNVLFIYMRNSRRIEWDFYYVDAFWLLIMAGVIGIWGLRQRKELFKNIMPAEPHALLGYLALASISFATIGYFFATANDPAVEALEDAVVFGHLSMGFVFLIYILFNFRDVLIANLKVYKVVYKPTKMPFFSMRLGGMIGALGLFLISNQYPLDQAITAYYNGIGDLHRLDQKPLLAKEYYKLAAIYAQSNHRSNYAIASMEREDNNLSEALAYFKQSTIKQPTTFSYVNTARVHEEQGMFFKAMFALKDGLVEFPESSHIANNLAALYAKIDVLDSAYYFLDNPSVGKKDQGVQQTNKLGLLARSRIDMPLDSLMVEANSQLPEVATNFLNMANNQGQPVSSPMLTIPQDTLLNPITFAWWYNFNLNQRYAQDGQQLDDLGSLLNVPENHLYVDNLEFSRIIRLYYSGAVGEAFLALRKLQFSNTSRSGFYNDLLGQWSLQQNQPLLALEFLDQSIRAGYLPAFWHRALVLIAIGEYQEAANSWGTFAYRTKEPVPELMSELVSFVNTPNLEWDSLSNQQKSWYLQFRSPNLTLMEKYRTLNELDEAEIHMQLQNWILDELAKEADRVPMQSLRDVFENHPEPFRELQLAVLGRDYQQLESLEIDEDQASHRKQNWRLYARALVNIRKGDTLEIEHHLDKLCNNPFFEQGILEASRYYREAARDDFRAYEILLDALSVNKFSIPLLKAYGIQCTRLNLDTYRETTLESLSELVGASDYQSYLLELQALEDTLSSDFESSED